MGKNKLNRKGQGQGPARGVVNQARTASGIEPLPPIEETGGALMASPGIAGLVPAGGSAIPAGLEGTGAHNDLKDVHQVTIKATAAGGAVALPATMEPGQITQSGPEVDMTDADLDAIKPGNVILAGPGGVNDGRGGVVLRLPVADVDGGYCSRHVEVGRLTPRQALALRMLRDGLYRSGARLPIPNTNEVRPVASNADVIRWILEKAGEGCGAE